GVHYFAGDALSALDIYWTAFANLLDPLPKQQCPMPEAWRPAFVVTDPVVKEALDPLLLEHRSLIFSTHFRDQMEMYLEPCPSKSRISDSGSSRSRRAGGRRSCAIAASNRASVPRRGRTGILVRKATRAFPTALLQYSAWLTILT